ncbi:MAG: adenylate kinase [Candidatus Dormibacteraeota bacterium]|uniref:Adenylate kinase n=1 Tax=Candidatus Dormiibacter inghamiae TaxID=3127013 RepID=A0A934NB46_9BACT|nr:adenylate kinase [Candidatus Dormibacteraeota bacterium]MBJ7605484.1 adenylate kinase [Candidatus Dormibacteraeota bacterium]
MSPQSNGSEPRSPLTLALFGPPGSGKGTQAAFLVEQLKIAQVSTGELFRQEVRRGTRLGRQAKEYIDRGELVPDEITMAMFRERLAKSDCAAGVLLDGFPRTAAQAEALAAFLRGLDRQMDRVIYIKVPQDVLVSRLSGRLTCPECGTTYHPELAPPRRAGLCDRDGGRLVQRDDDAAETALRRINVYKEQTASVVDYYRNLGLVAEVDGLGPIEDVRGRTLATVSQSRVG